MSFCFSWTKQISRTILVTPTNDNINTSIFIRTTLAKRSHLRINRQDLHQRSNVFFL